MWRPAHNMCGGLFLLLITSTAVLGDAGVLFDVTTVYNVSNSRNTEVVTGRVYARTNARGLRLYDGKETYITPKNFHLLDSACFGVLCGWDFNDWTVFKTKHAGTKCESHQHECYWTKMQYDDYYDFQEVVDSGNCISKTKFCNGESDCNDRSDEQHCSVHFCEPNGFLCQSKEKCIPLQWKCDDYKDCTDGSDEADCVEYVSANTFGQRMISPDLTLPKSHPSSLCLALVLHNNMEPESNLMTVFANVSGPLNLLRTVRSGQKDGWQVLHVNLNIPSNTSNAINLIFEAIAESEIKIYQISGCSLDGEEVESVPSHSYDSALPVYKPFIKYIDEPKTTTDSTKTCSNGGVMTTAGCACPPGFTGSKCEVGCGKYRFGQDCGGWCSAHLQGCKGLLLCNSFFNCLCAPGYMGSQCNITCDKGRYGNGCLQRCGDCASDETCDIFTGRCSSCKLGFVPPLCQKEFVYYNNEPEVLSTDYGKVNVTFDPKMVSGYGTPKLYQIQYSEKDDYNWYPYVSKILPSNKTEDGFNNTDRISEEIEGLEHGKRYKVRVLLLDSSFNKYDGDHVKYTEVLTKCDVPEEYDYRVNFQSSSTSLTFFWTYVTREHWCPLESYEISWKEGWQWLTKSTKEDVFTLEDIIPGTKIEFKVRVKTCNGFGPYSSTVTASTKNNGTSAVQNLALVSAASTRVDIKWDAPIGNEDRDLIYQVKLKCVQQPACPPGCVGVAESVLLQNKTDVTLSPLLPFTQYQVTVTPDGGSDSKIYIGTSEALPTEVPKPSEQTPLRSNTSLTVFWEPVPVCSGFLLGYNYHLLNESESLVVLERGFTKSTSVSFQNLTASTDYIIKVFIKTIAGWNLQSFLTIKTSTSATVPEVVRNLTVYKRSRNTLSLRWASPRAVYGQLKAFTVSYSLGSEVSNHLVGLTPCVPWPHLYCHTIQGLKANRRYNISVSARNMEIAEDGESVSVTEITKESSPNAPEGLTIINKSSTSVGLQWHYPDMANGNIRSFVVNVEETEKHDQNSCCQVYPLVEIPVQEEMPLYQAEVNELQPASTYYVSVTAKTVGLGPSRALTVHTQPPHLQQSILPSLNDIEGPFMTGGQNFTWQPEETYSEVNNSDVYSSLIKTHLLIGISNETESEESEFESGILNMKLDTLLRETINKPFYFLGEYTKGNLLTDSEWGKSSSPSPLLIGHTYQLIAVQVTEYNGVFNADLSYSSSFTV